MTFFVCFPLLLCVLFGSEPDSVKNRYETFINGLFDLADFHTTQNFEIGSVEIRGDLPRNEMRREMESKSIVIYIWVELPVHD